LPGFTLAEAMLATVVLAIAAAGVLLPFTSGAKVRTEGIRRTLAANLASDLMEEIIDKQFDEIDDFVDEHQDEDTMYAGFTRGASLDPNVKDYFELVTVWVKYNGREMAVINRLISK
jgi:Tfp pilus assembly protein PilV